MNKDETILKQWSTPEVIDLDVQNTNGPKPYTTQEYLSEGPGMLS